MIPAELYLFRTCFPALGKYCGKSLLLSRMFIPSSGVLSSCRVHGSTLKSVVHSYKFASMIHRPRTSIAQKCHTTCQGHGECPNRCRIHMKCQSCTCQRHATALVQASCHNRTSFFFTHCIASVTISTRCFCIISPMPTFVYWFSHSLTSRDGQSAVQ